MKREGAFVPERGNAVWITLNPRAGNEKAWASSRANLPAFVLSRMRSSRWS